MQAPISALWQSSRILHRYQRQYIYPMNMRDVEVPLVFNTYSALPNWRVGGVTEESVMALIAPAAQAGFEAFIIDAGWQTAIGDWTVHPTNFPRGLKPISDEVHRNGMKFGLWVEPERITRQAKLMKEKPEWLFANDGSSAMLNLSRTDVLEYVHGMMGWASMGRPIQKMSPEQLAEIKRHCDLFKKIRHITCRGEVHRLASFREHPYAAFEYVIPDASEALLFVFAHGLQHNERIPNILLESLDPDRTYDVEVYGAPGPSESRHLAKPPTYRSVSGRALMEGGILVALAGDYDSRIFHFKAR